MAYYTLLTYENGTWSPQFGDYDRETVSLERRDCYSADETKILKTRTARQSEINSAIAALNALD